MAFENKERFAEDGRGIEEVGVFGLYAVSLSVFAAIVHELQRKSLG